jgi:hypothetical protein
VTVITREGPWEPGTITLVDADTGIRLHYSGNDLKIASYSKLCPTNVGHAKPEMWVSKQWFPTDVPTGSGLIVAVIYSKSVYGPICVVLWSIAPRKFLTGNISFFPGVPLFYTLLQISKIL